MSVVASLETYRQRKFPPRAFQIDPVMTVYVALDGLLKALDRLANPNGDLGLDTRAARVAAERARIMQGIDFVFGGIDIQAGTLASGLIYVLMRDLRQRLDTGLARGETDFAAELVILRDLHAIFGRQISGGGHAHG
jgi:hypothetical protein